MRKVIDGKVYDTEKATMLAEYSNGRFRNDFSYVNEELYVTAKGNYFLYGEGGPMTKYAVSCGSNSWGGSSDIFALSEKGAYNWLVENGETEAIEKYFSDFIEEA